MAKTVDELKKLAHPALGYPELVELASKHSPNKAQEVAQGDWPRRQAKATRFLAMMRRDHPEAFDDYVSTSSEHAQPNGSD